MMVDVARKKQQKKMQICALPFFPHFLCVLERARVVFVEIKSTFLVTTMTGRGG